VHRRQFIESLSAAYLASKLDLVARAAIINSDLSPGLAPASPVEPALIPIPASVPGVTNPVVDLTGKWLFAPLPPAEFWQPNLDLSKWSAIEVPGELVMQGFDISPDVEYPCRRTLQIPGEFANHRIFVRFDGVYSRARVWVNGVLVRDHCGGFTSWDAEITDHVQAGSSAQIVIGITDRSDDISQGSYYAKHSIAGMLRGIRMFAVPKTHLRDLAVTASFDPGRGGAISLKAELSSPDGTGAALRFTLRDSSSAKVAFEPASEPVISPEKPLVHELRVGSVRPWDAEHPNLYRLEIDVVVGGQVMATLERMIGFRTVHRAGNQLLVNGQPVKLHGVCRHSIHPLHGRAVPPEFDEKDVVLFREANVNFVRTSHYPPSEAFLVACDRHGIYVEEETAVCWSTESSSNPELKDRFLTQFREMIARDRHHPCVLFWSLGNESNWGPNIAAEKEYARQQDPTRPTIFSYPDTAPLATNGYDIYSKHYADVDSSLDSSTYPLLNDEFAHVSCYNLDTLRRDPGVRNFWGESIKRFGDRFLAADGCLGGSIWAGIDEVFLLPDRPTGYGEWGIIDGWRRKKPEHWLTRKAYSPVRVDEANPLPLPEPGKPLVVPVRNAFNHTNVSELEMRWTAGSDSGSIVPQDIAPHNSGVIEIPPRRWLAGDKLKLEFRANQSLVEQVELIVGSAPRSSRSPSGSDLSCDDRVNDYLISGPEFSLVVSKQTGLIAEAKLNQEPILRGGPFLDVGSGAITSWLMTKSEVMREENQVIILTQGAGKAVEGIDGIPVQFEIVIDADGGIMTRYRAEIKPGEHPNLGIAYLLPDSFDKLAWKRKALWSAYPDDHIGRAEGVALRTPAHPAPAYRQEPTWPWSEDNGDPFLWGKSGFDPGATNDFRSLKPNIWLASLSAQNGKSRVRAEADADVAVRASLQAGAVCFSMYNYWSYPDLTWGNYTGPGAPPALTTLETRMWLTDEPDEHA
jgi:Glycosyl hydrolases family 2, TIM barrel domain/Glycosyl hydrolases family 2, sugar binding domain/Glycosyl hydrolases family 2